MRRDGGQPERRGEPGGAEHRHPRRLAAQRARGDEQRAREVAEPERRDELRAPEHRRDHGEAAGAEGGERA